MNEFIAARLLGGVAVGVASMLAPLYIAENSPPRIRGRLVAFNQMAIVSGILLAYLVNWLLSGIGPNAWRWMFAVAAIPATPNAVVWAAESAKARNHHAACSPIDGTRARNTSATSSSWTWAKIGKADRVPKAMTASGTSETKVV